MVLKLEIDEDAGELLCDKCKGKGSTPSNQDPYTMAAVCSKCQGRGKVDWISHITGVPSEPMFGFSSTSSYYVCSTPGGASQSQKIHDDAIDAMSKNLAKKIDEEIIESIMKGSNKNIKMYDQEVHTLDNGIVSKLLFYPNT